MKKRALLIGMDKYIPSHSIQACELPCTRNDVQALEKRLKQIDFSTTQIIDNSISDMKTTIKSFAAAPCDSINVIYFSGHGGQYRGTNYIYPIDFGTNLDRGNTIEESAYDIQEFAKAFSRDVILVIIIDACRDCLMTTYSNNYSELADPKNTYIAYATQFNEVSKCNNQMSYFTQALCENILIPNLSVDKLFINVRASLYLKYSKQIANSVNAFLEYVSLNSQIEKDNLGVAVYEFVNKFGDMYIEKYGCFAGDDLIFIDAAQYCNISVLDAIYKFRVIDREKCCLTTSLTEAHEKLISFWEMLNHGLKQDEYYTWQYRGRPIRLGEIPPLPVDMQKPIPDNNKAIDVQIDVNRSAKLIEIITNLPDNMELYGNINGSYYFYNVVIKNRKAIIHISDSVDAPKAIEICSVIANVTSVDKEVVGDRYRNLIGKHVKFHPVYGNQINYHGVI